ncbi:hypothetical protein F5Y14DRAFT_89712 [Nemania sp. NC0429]|nr:hypothetical protein F5Y14DRAFT_89712 [Nemania sp. NC0429]
MRRALVAYIGQICLASGSTTDGLSGLVPFLFGNLPSMTWGDLLPYGMSASKVALFSIITTLVSLYPSYLWIVEM